MESVPNVQKNRDERLTEAAIFVEWNKAKNRDIDPYQLKIGSSKSVWWMCAAGHEWKNSIKNRILRGQNCPYCSGHKVIPGETDLQTLYPKIAKKWNHARNNPLYPYQVKPFSNKRVWWQCKKGHEWQAKICDTVIKNVNCPYCSGKRVKKGSNDLKTLNPELAKEWHPSKNRSILPEHITKGSNKKVWWQCKKGHEWQATVKNRGRGTGCPYCDRRVIPGENDFATEKPELSREWNYEKNGLLFPNQIKTKSNLRVWWKCSKGHEWQATIYSRTIAKRGCPFCSGYKVTPGENDLLTTNPTLAKEWHKEKNGKLTVRDVSTYSNKKVWWQCEKGHSWKASVNHRSRGTGCPYCYAEKIKDYG